MPEPQTASPDPQYALVKQLFFDALALPAKERAAFLRQACDDQLVREEVETLLSHHLSETILNVTDARASAEDVRAAEIIESAPWVAMSEENRDLLRNRLNAVVLMLCIGLAISLIRDLAHPSSVAIIARVVRMSLMLACLGILWSRITLQLLHLRLLELVVLLNMGLLGTIVDVQFMLRDAALGDVGSVAIVNANNYHVWSLVILIYGIFMPNTWMRAAIILIPCAFVPYLVTLGVCAWSESVSTMLSQTRYRLPIVAPFLAAFTAVYAAHVIHSVRRDAFRAKRYAQYRLTGLIGVGGMGEVYKAEHLLLKRSCAIKLIREERHDNPEVLARFEREVTATARLTHPNTIEVFDYGQTSDGAFYLVMELLPGMSLGELIHRFGRIPPARAIHFLLQVSDALQKAHSQGLIHRDIKPANVFAAERGGRYDVAKLLDFGLVRETNLSASPQLTAENTIGGTPLFMAPEQAVDYRKADARSDIYSLGCVAYYLVTGQTPFRGDSAMAIILSHNNDEVQPPSRILAELPRDLEEVILRCLRKSPDERFQSATELEAALARCGVAEKWTRADAQAWWENMAQYETPKQVEP